MPNSLASWSNSILSILTQPYGTATLVTTLFQYTCDAIMDAPHDEWVNNLPLLTLMTASEVIFFAGRPILGSPQDMAQLTDYCWC